jgi:alpha-mannosidase
VSAGGLTVLHEGVREYELIDNGSALAVTILRATGILSRPLSAARPNIAGPPIAVNDAQMLGPVTARYAVVVGDVDPWQLGEDLWTPMKVVTGSGTGHLAEKGSRLQVNGGQVSSLRRSAGRIEMRLFNPSDAPAQVDIPGHHGVVVDLRGNELGAWDGSLELGPWEIKTVLLDAVSLDP